MAYIMASLDLPACIGYRLLPAVLGVILCSFGDFRELVSSHRVTWKLLCQRFALRGIILGHTLQPSVGINFVYPLVVIEVSCFCPSSAFSWSER